MALLLGACATGGSRQSERIAGVYSSVLRAVAPDPFTSPPTRTGDLDRVVYVGPLDEDVGISIEVQAAVVEDLEDFATIRFVDEREEAIDDSEGAPVLEGGVLVLLGPVPAGRELVVEAERYVDAADAWSLRVALQRRGDIWAVAQVRRAGG